MSAPRPTSRSALVRLRLTGVAFLLVIASLVYLTVLLYTKAFTPIVKVELKADRIGNQLSPPADVKLRGVVVGRGPGGALTGQRLDDRPGAEAGHGQAHPLQHPGPPAAQNPVR